uniref:Uncharacterized protein n=1 Tax=Anopheles arabiensis TaxID=7173 RepID=A0A182IFT3_ANOAR
MLTVVPTEYRRLTNPASFRQYRQHYVVPRRRYPRHHVSLASVELSGSFSSTQHDQSNVHIHLHFRMSFRRRLAVSRRCNNIWTFSCSYARCRRFRLSIVLFCRCVAFATVTVVQVVPAGRCCSCREPIHPEGLFR